MRRSAGGSASTSEGPRASCRERARRCGGGARPQPEVPRGGRAVLQPSAGEGGPFGEPDEAATATGDAGGTHHAWVAYLDRQAIARGSVHDHRYLGVAGVL